jgi:hypothetical protein
MQSQCQESVESKFALFHQNRQNSDLLDLRLDHDNNETMQFNSKMKENYTLQNNIINVSL